MSNSGRKILVDGIFINKGGGAVLLQYLIEKIKLHPRKDDFYFLLDPRFAKPELPTSSYTIINNKLGDRISFYRAHKGEYAKVFCFANTPPPIHMGVPTFTYFHNQKLLEAPSRKFEKNYFRIYIKYLFTKLFNRNTDYYIVQTPHMVQELVAVGLKDTAHCLTIPFYDDTKYKTGQTPFQKRPADEFVFISNPSPQKNYPTLLDAWESLLSTGHTPLLHVTIDDTAPQLIERVNQLTAKGARIINHVYLDPKSLYYNCPYLIFPSVVESFGLPLIEAVDSGMKVLASDLPYVHDVITPSLTFNPKSKDSIAAAVRTALATPTLPFPSIVTRNEVDVLIALLAT